MEQQNQPVGEDETGPEYTHIATKDRPAEAVDDTHHRIEQIEQPPLLRDDAAGEADRGDVVPELDDERDDIAKVAVLDVESC